MPSHDPDSQLHDAIAAAKSITWIADRFLHGNEADAFAKIAYDAEGIARRINRHIAKREEARRKADALETPGMEHLAETGQSDTFPPGSLVTISYPLGWIGPEWGRVVEKLASGNYLVENSIGRKKEYAADRLRPRKEDGSKPAVVKFQIGDRVTAKSWIDGSVITGTIDRPYGPGWYLVRRDDGGMAAFSERRLDAAS